MFRTKLQAINLLSKRRKITMLVFLVFFVFGILFVSVLISGIISYFLFEAGVMPPLENNRFPLVFVFILLFSLGIGTLLAMVGGRYAMRPLRKLTAATKEIAAGNFEVQVDATGPDEFKRLALSFNEMTKELASIETLRSDFVNNISHEFKTPVVSIRGFAKLLKKDTLTKKQRDEYLDIIISESDRLTSLSSNVLLLSKLECMEFTSNHKEYALDEQLRRAILLLEPQFCAKNLELEIEIDPSRIAADEELMQHVWINILNNAIKFSPEQGTVRVEAHSKEDVVEVTITDHGTGMNEEAQRYLFDKFYQADSSRATEGNGLGLSLVKKILELSGGTVEVQSAPGEGTSITVKLQAIPPADHNAYS
ncbi:HAMP domain-containing histidine kinase [Christensenellaceae bacterium OttesenSCG-928-K19]|nr:HAMP domain-containing histidine kinase [Christensenellaceae bacterium OttesenSCG-928-K19]